MTTAERRARQLLYRHLPSWRQRLLYRIFRSVLIPTDIGEFKISRRAKSHRGPGIAIMPKGTTEIVEGCVICAREFEGELPHSDHVLNLLLRIKADPLVFMRDVNWDNYEELQGLTHFMEPPVKPNQFVCVPFYWTGNGGVVSGTVRTTISNE